MQLDHFFNGSDDNTTRILRKAYQKIEFYFKDSLNYDLQLNYVVADNQPGFHFIGERYLTIRPHQDEIGTLFHEVTHDLFHSSVFHSIYNNINNKRIKTDCCDLRISNEDWGEGFCESMRWLMGKEIKEDQQWRGQFESDCLNGDLRKQCAKRILLHAHFTLEGFASLWHKLSDEYNNLFIDNDRADFLVKQLNCPICSMSFPIHS